MGSARCLSLPRLRLSAHVLGLPVHWVRTGTDAPDAPGSPKASLPRNKDSRVAWVRALEVQVWTPCGNLSPPGEAGEETNRKRSWRATSLPHCDFVTFHP